MRLAADPALSKTLPQLLLVMPLHDELAVRVFNGAHRGMIDERRIARGALNASPAQIDEAQLFWLAGGSL